MPESYGTSGGGLLLHISGFSGEPGFRFPAEMPPRSGPGDIDPAVAERMRTMSPSGTVLVWPMQMRLGWPARSMGYWHDGYYGWGSHGWASGMDRKPRTAWGYEVKAGMPPFEGAVIPLEPLWTGLAINTGVFGAVVFAGGLALGRGRGAWRRRRGRCVACGYEVGILDKCPECGRARLEA